MHLFSEQNGKIVKTWPFNGEHYKLTLQPDSQHLLLLQAKDPVRLPYGHSQSVFFKMAGLEGGEVKLTYDGFDSAWRYLQGKENDCIQFSFMTTEGVKKNFSLNTKISGIIVDLDMAERGSQNYHDKKQIEGVFYKIMKTNCGVPLAFMSMRLKIDDHQNFDIDGCIRPKFFPTDKRIDVMLDSAAQFCENKIFEDFSLSKWRVKEKRIMQQSKKMRTNRVLL